MKSLLFLSFLLAVFSAVLSTPQRNSDGRHGDDKVKLRFKIFGRNLADKDKLGTIDPYVKLYYTENEGTSETKFGRSATLTNTENPDWSDVYTFDFDRNKRQVSTKIFFQYIKMSTMVG